MTTMMEDRLIALLRERPGSTMELAANLGISSAATLSLLRDSAAICRGRKWYPAPAPVLTEAPPEPTDPVAQLGHALGLIPERDAPEEWERLLRRVQYQTGALRRLRAGLADVRDAAVDLLSIQLDEEDPRLIEARRGRDEYARRSEEAHQRLARVREVCTRWGWNEEQIASLLALPGEKRTHVFPPPAQADLREVTPRVHQNGDPRPGCMVLWLSDGVWRPLHSDCLVPGDRWLPMPPPPPETK